MIIDNFLSDEDYKIVKEYVLGPRPHWYYGENLSLGHNEHGIIDSMAQDTWGFNRDIFNSEIEYGDSEALGFMVPVMKRIIGLNGPETKFKRIRLGMKCFKHGFIDGNYNLPHIDYHFPHKTLILYMNDTDGDTYVFNEHYTGKNLKSFTIQERIKPIENRAVILDGFHYHTASNPLYHDTRVVINVNYV
jgi:hypothetical protein